MMAQAGNVPAIRIPCIDQRVPAKEKEPSVNPSTLVSTVQNLVRLRVILQSLIQFGGRLPTHL